MKNQQFSNFNYINYPVNIYITKLIVNILTFILSIKLYLETQMYISNYNKYEKPQKGCCMHIYYTSIR